MADDVEKDVGVALDTEIKPPIFGDPCLPAVAVVLFGAERRVAVVDSKKSGLFVKSQSDTRRSALIAPAEALGVDKPH